MDKKVYVYKKKALTPCLRWAGGKRRHLKDMASILPPRFDKYFEPMVGAGALFLRLMPEEAVIGDSNADLIHFYKILRDNTDELILRLSQLEPSGKAYYKARSLQPASPIANATRFAFLNRLAWNGVYRVNKLGKFNVPFGKRIPKKMWDFENMRAIASLLQTTILFNGDFEECLKSVSDGDFVFLDPPYPRGANNGMGFNRYTSHFFSVDDHKRLALVAKILANRGAFVLVAECAHPEISDMYKDGFNSMVVEGKSLIAGKVDARKLVAESFYFSYQI